MAAFFIYSHFQLTLQDLETIRPNSRQICTFCTIYGNEAAMAKTKSVHQEDAKGSVLSSEAGFTRPS